MKAEYISHSLSDKDVANFARQSFGRLADDFTEEQNHNLIRFLARGTDSASYKLLLEEVAKGTGSVENAVKTLKTWRNTPEHWVPFGHPTISLRMQAPVPIARQAFKHKIGFVESEESRRYISNTPALFVPDHFRAKAANVKQGSDSSPHPNSSLWLEEYTGACNHLISIYETMIADGICPEQARLVLPQGVEVNWVWTGSLYSYANFFNQRSDSHAQKEIQDLAHQVSEIIAPLYPVSWAALTEAKY